MIIYLGDQFKPKTWIDIHESLLKNVLMDANADTGPHKIQSVFVSLKKTMRKMTIGEDGSTGIEGVSFGPVSQMKLILSKLPTDFVMYYKMWQVYHEKVDTPSALYRQLIDVSQEFSGSWDLTGRFLSRSIYEEDFEELANDHTRRHTRSKTKK